MKKKTKLPLKKFFQSPRLEVGRVLIEELTVWKSADKPTEEEFYRLVDRIVAALPLKKQKELIKKD